ncbi:MAG: biopolymer transporter ExbD [Leeuwenhoekiella sp.]|uniref:Biopolymer transporter ExbD n=1 Tax=Leeuwenhoekiella nanhaiensis TaxID=1655491 RepID=A0A2G1VUT7_9FLAO|nr:MotA/TolQ/ExbB proton channel family protein [Leeuwenhoekiella nanhaiensis]PHQ30526.1 biopolymer transporter ExbD [Leeuwenhoekiella nanhaiensis]PHR87813.1 MAG: biopolymer transporter ExbD [Leeuwenhoekiella sp.]
MLLDRIQEGGPFFMWPIVIVFIVIVALFVRQLLSKADKAQTIVLISNISLFILSWGILGSVIGLIEAFDAVESMGDVSQGMMAGGLKVAFLTTVFGLVTFIFARLFILILNLLKG